MQSRGSSVCTIWFRTRRKLLASTFSDYIDKNNRPHILGYLGASRLFPCASGDRILTNRRELIITRFTGAPVRTFLFIRWVNLNWFNAFHTAVLDKLTYLTTVQHNKCWVLITGCLIEVQQANMFRSIHDHH